MKRGLKEILDKFYGKRVLVLGDIILDKFSWGEIERLNPEQPAAPNVNVEESEETYSLGGAAKVANNVVSMGGNCKLYGILGRDFYGYKLKSLCEQVGISLIPIYNGNQTIVKQRVMAHGQQVARLNYGEKNRNGINPKEQKGLIKILEKDIENCDFIIFSDYNKGFFNENIAQEIIEITNFKGIQNLVDVKPANINYFKGCMIIRPNQKEAEEITGIKCSNERDNLVEIGKRLCEKVNSKYAIITLGKNGVFSYDKSTNQYMMIKTKAKVIADVAGAGDTFAAAASLALSSGLNVHEASRLANYAAGIVVEKIGVATANLDEIKQKIEQENL